MSGCRIRHDLRRFPPNESSIGETNRLESLAAGFQQRAASIESCSNDRKTGENAVKQTRRGPKFVLHQDSIRDIDGSKALKSLALSADHAERVYQPVASIMRIRPGFHR